MGGGHGLAEFLIGQGYGILAGGFQPSVQFVTVKAIAFAGLGGRNASVRQFHVERSLGNTEIFRRFIHGHGDMGVHRLCIVHTALLGKQASQAHHFVPKLGYDLR